MPRRRGRLGEDGERLAEGYLQRQGLRVVGRGVRIAGGEIDLIGVERGTLVFVEVKTRQSTIAGHPLEAVTPRKQQQLVRLARAYLRQHRLLECPVRFDVVGVLWPDGGQPTVTHVRHAFDASGSEASFF